MSTEALVSSVLIQLIIMIAAARLMNWVFSRFGQPGVIGEIVAGLLLGPSLFGYFFPNVAMSVFNPGSAPAITILSQVGLTLLMFQIGSDFDFGHLRHGRNSMTVGITSLASITVPFILGLFFGVISTSSLAPGIEPVSYSLFCGVAVAITAVPILGRILRQYGLTDKPIGVVAITSAAINDVVGWILLACIATYVASHLSAEFILITVGSIALLGLVQWFVLRHAVTHLLRLFPIVDDTLPPNLLAVVLCLIFALAVTTYSIGIFTIFGGFAAGLLFHHHTRFTEAWRRQVGQFVLVFFLPVFFTATGLRTNVLGLSYADIGWLGLILTISIAGKIFPVYLAGRVSGLDRWQSAVLGSLMNTRALMELIVLNVGYNLHVIPQNVFTMLVIMAVVTTVMTGPLLQLLLPRMGHSVARLVEA